MNVRAIYAVGGVIVAVAVAIFLIMGTGILSNSNFQRIAGCRGGSLNSGADASDRPNE